MRETMVRTDAGSTYVLVFDEGDDTASGLREWARRRGVTAGHLSGVGGFQRATLGFFDPDGRSYVEIAIEEQVEVLSMLGDFSAEDGQPHVHVHVVVGDRDARARGGHLLEGIVRPTLEVIIVEAEGVLPRRFDRRTGLSLIDPELFRGTTEAQ